MTVMPGLCGRFGVSPAIYGPPMLLRQASLTAFHRVLFLRRLNGTAGGVVFFAVSTPPPRTRGMNKIGLRAGARIYLPRAPHRGGAQTPLPPCFFSLRRA